MSSYTCIIISVGTEIVNGTIQDKHLKYLAQQLGMYSFSIIKAVHLPDYKEIIINELYSAVSKADLVILTGGLGPTSDDITRYAIAEVANVELVFNERAWAEIEKRLKGRPVAEVNRRQAEFPKGFSMLNNSLGTAPGFAGPIGNALVIALPGPPRELEAVYREEVVPLLGKHFCLEVGEEQVLKCSIFMTPESLLEETLRGVRRGDVIWGTRVTPYSIELYLKGGSAEDRRTMLKGIESKLGNVRVREGFATPHFLLAELLKKKNWMLATAESCTGGLIGKLITDIPGSSRIYWGGFVAYSNTAKMNVLGVNNKILETHGAVSAVTAEEMAINALKLSVDCNISIAVTGIAGPEGGTKEKPVGTVFIAVALEGMDIRSRAFNFFGNRERIRRKTAITAMLFAENTILGGEWLDSYDRW